MILFASESGQQQLIVGLVAAGGLTEFGQELFHGEFSLSSPAMSMTTRPSYIIMSRLPWAMASFMLWVIISVVRLSF